MNCNPLNVKVKATFSPPLICLTSEPILWMGCQSTVVHHTALAHSFTSRNNLKLQIHLLALFFKSGRKPEKPMWTWLEYVILHTDSNPNSGSNLGPSTALPPQRNIINIGCHYLKPSWRILSSTSDCITAVTVMVDWYIWS